MTAGLRIQGLSVPRGPRLAVDDVTLTVPPGEITTLLGPNGAGKSTLVLGVAGVLPAAAGTVEIDGVSLRGSSPEAVRRAGVAVVPEGRRLLPTLTVEDNLRVATYSLKKSKRREGVKYALELFPELEKRWTVEAGRLSGGEQQMVVLAQAICSRPRVMLVDELSLGLAPTIVKRLMPALKAVADAGAGVLLIEQFAQLALEVSSRAYVLEGSRIRYSGTSRELIDDPTLLHAAYLLRKRGGAEPAVGSSPSEMNGVT
jgi:branched-chain amino acid transport system ATP-binding protein